MNQTTCEFEDLETATVDPLAELGLDMSVEIAAVQQAADNPTPEIDTAGIERISEFLEKPVRDGEPLYLDFEAIPDFGRMHMFNLEPLPTMPPVDAADALMAPEEFISRSVPEIIAWLAKHNPPAEWLGSVRAAEQESKKPRKGCYDALDDHDKRIASIASAEADRVKLLSCNPLYCAICCVSFAVGEHAPVSIYCGAEVLMERHLLEMCWKMIARHSPIIGYGLKYFDIPVLLARSMILGVHPSKSLDRRKYGSRDIVDLGQEFWGDSSKEKGEEKGSRGLMKMCRCLGINSSVPNVDGSHVYDLFKAGKSDEIREYCEDDVRLVQRLHREKLAGYFCV